AFGAISPESAVEHRLSEERARRDVIWMAIRPIRRSHHARPMPSNEVHRLPEVLGIAADLSIGPAEIVPPRRPQRLARRFGLRQPLFHRAVAPHFSRRQIAKAHSKA